MWRRKEEKRIKVERKRKKGRRKGDRKEGKEELENKKEVIKHSSLLLASSSFSNISSTFQKHNVDGGTGYYLVCSILCSILIQTQPLNKLLGHTTAVALNRDRMFEVKSGSFTGLALLRRAAWSVLLPKAMLVCGPCFGRGPC